MYFKIHHKWCRDILTVYPMKQPIFSYSASPKRVVESEHLSVRHPRINLDTTREIMTTRTDVQMNPQIMNSLTTHFVFTFKRIQFRGKLKNIEKVDGLS